MDSFHSKLNHDMFSPFTSHVTVLQRKIINTPINAVNNFTTENDVIDSSNTPSSGQNTTFQQVKPLMMSRVLKSNVGANASPSIYIQFWNPKLIRLNHHYVEERTSRKGHFMTNIGHFNDPS